MIHFKDKNDLVLYNSLRGRFNRKFKIDNSEPFDFKHQFSRKLKNQLGKEACNLIVIKVKRNDGMTWLSHKISDLCRETFAINFEESFHSLALKEINFPLLEDLVGEHKFKLFSDIYLKTNFFIPKRLGAFITAIIINLLPILTNLTNFTKIPFMYALLILVIILLVGYFFRGDESEEYTKIHQILMDGNHKNQIKKFRKKLAKMIRSGSYPRLVLVDNFSAADSLTKTTIEKYFLDYQPKSSGWETWVVLEYDYNPHLFDSIKQHCLKESDSLTFHGTFLYTEYFSYRDKESIIREHNLHRSDSLKIDKSNIRYRAVKNLVKTDNVGFEERLSFEQLASKLDTERLKLAFILSGSSKSINTPFDGKTLSQDLFLATQADNVLGLLVNTIWPSFKNHYTRANAIKNDLDRITENFKDHLVVSKDRSRILFSPVLYDLFLDYNITHRLFEPEEIQFFHAIFWSMRLSTTSIFEPTWCLKIRDHLMLSLNDIELIESNELFHSYSKELILKLLNSLRSQPQPDEDIPFELLKRAILIINDEAEYVRNLRSLCWKFYQIYHSYKFIDEINSSLTTTKLSTTDLGDSWRISHFQLLNLLNHPSKLDFRESEYFKPLILAYFSSQASFVGTNCFLELNIVNDRLLEEIQAELKVKIKVENEFEIMPFILTIWSSTTLLMRRIKFANNNQNKGLDKCIALLSTHIDNLIHFNSYLESYERIESNYHHQFTQQLGYTILSSSFLLLEHAVDESDSHFTDQLSRFKPYVPINAMLETNDALLLQLVNLWQSFGFPIQADILRLIAIEYHLFYRPSDGLDLYRKYQFHISSLMLYKPENPISLWGQIVLAQLSNKVNELYYNHIQEIKILVDQHYERDPYFNKEINNFFALVTHERANISEAYQECLKRFHEEFDFAIYVNSSLSEAIVHSYKGLCFKLGSRVMNQDETFKKQILVKASDVLKVEQIAIVSKHLEFIHHYNTARNTHEVPIQHILSDDSTIRKKIEYIISYLNANRLVSSELLDEIEREIISQPFEEIKDNLYFRFATSMMDSGYVPSEEYVQKIVDSLNSFGRDLNPEQAVKYYKSLLEVAPIDEVERISEELKFWNQVGSWIRDQKNIFNNLQKIQQSQYLQLLISLYMELDRPLQSLLTRKNGHHVIKDSYKNHEIMNDFKPIIEDKFNPLFFLLALNRLEKSNSTKEDLDQLNILNSLSETYIIPSLELIIENMKSELKLIYQTYLDSLNEVLEPSLILEK